MSAGLAATDWLVQSVPDHGTASRFILDHHYSHSTSNTSVYRHGLYFDDPDTSPLVGELMGVALWLPPTRVAAETVDENWRGVLSLSRFAVHPDAPKNAASFLLAASMRLINRRTWPTLLTYADMGHDHTGAIYLATNWIRLGEVAAGDTWTGPNGEQRGRKRGPTNLTVEYMLARGYVRNERTANPARPSPSSTDSACSRGNDLGLA